MLKFRKILLTVITLTLSMMTANFNSAGDSSSLQQGFTISKRLSHSLLGTVNDMKICRYRSEDGRLHCDVDSSSSATQTLIVAKTLKSQLRHHGSGSRGQVVVSSGHHYGFSSPETVTLNDSKTAYIHCKLALEFQLSNQDMFWIWHDEIRFNPSSAMAYIDSNGDQLADLAIRGHWTGSFTGVRRWQPIDPANSFYSDAQRKFPSRPSFGEVNGLGRRCDITNVVVARLVPPTPYIQDTVSGEMRKILGISDD